MLQQTGSVSLFWRRYRKNWLGILGLILLVTVISATVAAPSLAPSDPNVQNRALSRQTPSSEFLLGTDQYGRDILSRILYGGRSAFFVAGMSTILGLVVGTVIGTISGYYGGIVDEALMRCMDLLLSFPFLLLALAIVTALGPGLRNAAIAIGVGFIPRYARLTRSSTLSLKSEDFVEAARASGASTARILFRYIAPNYASELIVYSTLSMASALLMEAALSFLGLGVQPPTSSWGEMIRTGREFLRTSPHMSLFPGLAIMWAVVGLNLTGEAVRDALDPKMHRS